MRACGRFENKSIIATVNILHYSFGEEFQHPAHGKFKVNNWDGHMLRELYN
jgi:hypothetical protein